MFCIADTKWHCVNFGGWYGYDLVVVFKEFLHKRCYFSNSDKATTSIHDLALQYITFLQQNYDNSVYYQEKENEKLVITLIGIYNKQTTTNIKLNLHKKQRIVTNVYLKS
jgi:hypothetical protein